MTCGDDDESSFSHTHSHTQREGEGEGERDRTTDRTANLLISSNVHYVHFGGDKN